MIAPAEIPIYDFEQATSDHGSGALRDNHPLAIAYLVEMGEEAAPEVDARTLLYTGINHDELLLPNGEVNPDVTARDKTYAATLSGFRWNPFLHAFQRIGACAAVSVYDPDKLTPASDEVSIPTYRHKDSALTVDHACLGLFILARTYNPRPK